MKNIVLLAVAFCFLSLTGCENTREAKKPVRISLHVWPGYAYALLAQEKGFFKKNHVDVELVLKRSSTESFKLFTDGEVDGCFDVLADVVMASADGIAAKIVLCVDYSTEGDVIIGRPGITSLHDLRGKTVSFEGINTFSQIFVINMLLKAGLNESDVHFKNIKAFDVLAAAEEGKIDAGHTWEPITSLALQKGYTILAKAGDIPGLITDVLAFTPNVLKERPADIVAILQSLFQAQKYLHDHPVEAIKIMADKMGMTTSAMRRGLKGLYVPNLKENINLLYDKTSGVSASERMIIDFYFKRGQLSHVPEIQTLVEPRFLEELSNE